MGSRRALAVAALIGLGLAGGPGPIAGQDPQEVRILTVVDYLTETEVYLAAGTDHGIQVGDTLRVYDGAGEGAELLGVFAIQSANERRSVATFVSAPFEVFRADLLYLGLPQELVQARLQKPEESEEAAETPSTQNRAAASNRA